MALLLTALVVVALAGQAYQSHAGSTTDSPAPKGKAKAKAPVQPTAKDDDDRTKDDEGTTTPPKPQPTVVHVFLGPVPEGVPDPEGVLAAARAALRDWDGEGLELREAGAGEADVTLQFVADAADAGDSSSGVAVVPLGDSSCGGSWSAYATGSVQDLAARALGEAMGRDGPDRLMDPVQPRHAQECAATHGTLSLAPGQADGKAFRLSVPAIVSYTMRVQGGFADVCLLPPSGWDAFAAGEGNGTACHFAAQEGSDGAELEAGDWALGIRCLDTGSACEVDYTLSARAA